MNKKILVDKAFKRHYKKRILPNLKLLELYKKSLKLFIQDAYHPQLRNHKLKGGMHQYRAFCIDDDCRVVYLETESEITFVAIGKHEEIYK